MKKVLVSFIIIAVIFHPHWASGIEGGDVAGKISFGYDDNIFEQAGSETGRPFLRLYLDSRLLLLRSHRLIGHLRLQDGFKMVGERENIALNQVNLRFALRVTPQISSEILSELKHKSVSISSSSSTPSEYGYLNWHGGVSVKFNRNNLSSNIKYLERRRDYADSDFIDANIRQLQFVTSTRFSRKLTGNFMTGWHRSRFPQFPISEQGETATQTRIDNLREFGFGFQWIGSVLINSNYLFQRNKSSLAAFEKGGRGGISEYSFRAHQLSILAASSPFWGVTMQLYGHLQLRNYDSQETPTIYLSDEDNDEQARNIIILSISRGIFENCSLEGRYLLSQSDASKYTKRAYSVTLNYLF